MKYNYESYGSISTLKSELQDEFGLDSGFDMDGRDPAYNSLEVIRTEDKIIVGLLQYDNHAQDDYWSNDEGAGKLTEFRNKNQRDEELQRLSKTKKLFYLVNKYAHGNVHYSVSGTSSYPDMQFDVAHGCALFIPCDDIQKQYRKMKKTEGEGVAYEHFIKDSNSVLNNYSDWCNGNIYGYTVLTFDHKGNELECDECWGFIGDDYANEEKHRVMQHTALYDMIDKIAENVSTDKLTPKDLKLPFKITKKGLEEAYVSHVYDTFVVGAKYAGEDNVAVYKWTVGDEKPTKGKFEEWQKRHFVTPESFMNARMKSDIREAIKKEMEKEDTKTNKPTV